MSTPVQIDCELRGTLDLAIQIADHAVRSDIECFASISGYAISADVGEGQALQRTVYDTERLIGEPAQGCLRKPDVATEADDLAIIQRALRYIEQRGDALPFVLRRSPADPALVWFEDRPAPAAMTEAQRMDSEYAQAVDRG